MGARQAERRLSGTDMDLLERAIDAATASVAEGGGPFGALVSRGSRVLAVGQNAVTRVNDPTAHAEIVAIRAACDRLGTFTLAGCTLFASCEPCPMCLAAALWARIDRIVFAASRNDAACAGFDDRAFYDLFETDPGTWRLPVVIEEPSRNRTEPFDAWGAKPDRVEY